ncbi:MAG: hypothetical protein ACTHO8_05150 [Solirubrobacterales bacterium]
MSLKSPPGIKAVLVAAVVFWSMACLARAETIQRDGVRIGFNAKIRPRALPRHGQAPLRVSLKVRIAAANGKVPPQLRHISVAINRHGRFNPGGLPVCRIGEIQPATTSAALQACRRSLVGSGSFSAKVLLPEQAPFPSAGRIYAFNGRYQGAPAILAHVYGTQPVPTSFTLAFRLRPTHGTYGTVLTASLPKVTSQWGYVTGLQITLGRQFPSHGTTHSYLTGSCPAPPALSVAPFPLASGTYRFTGKGDVQVSVPGSCRVRG